MGQAEHTLARKVDKAGVVLVVEDDWLQRIDISDFLRSKGFRVIEAATGEEAAAVLAAGEQVDLVFCDVQLPGQMGGISLTVWAKSYFPAIPVILTSANESISTRLGGGETAPFISKPYDPEQVASQILLLLSNRSTPQSQR
jgi:two-component system, response regulator PdtaR